jgi:ActR/RegA family two-component response regulator
MRAGQGLVVALGYRIITVLVAAVGVCYYLASRQEVARVLHAAEQEVEQKQSSQASTTETVA